MDPIAGACWSGLKLYSRVAPTQRGGYQLTRLARGLIPRDKWKGWFVAPGRMNLNLDLSTYPDCCMANGLYELDTARVIRRLLGPGKHFVDVGANIGYFTLIAAAIVGPQGRVDAYEPDPINRARLQDHVEANGPMPQVRVRPFAASDCRSLATLRHPLSGGNHGQASLFEIGNGSSSSFEVETIRLDQDLDHSPDLIKMDVEGAELVALRGLTGLLAAERAPALIVEHNPVSAKAAGFHVGDILRQLQSCNPAYRAFWVGWRLIPIDSPEEMGGITREGNVLYKLG